jgi:tetratricopeptide (TPR) repeat protein
MAPAKPLIQPDSLTWKPPPLLIEWGCALMREAGPPTPIERIWHLAAIAVAQRWGDYEFLIDSPEPRGNRQDEIDHLVHVAKRFPNEARIVLAQAIAIEWRVWALRGPRSNVAEGIRAFERLTGDPAVGAEATLRLGSLRVRSRDFGRAVEHFDRVETMTRDRYLIYLARYFRGRAREQQERFADAELDYRGALATIPHATSATLALAAILARSDRRAEASALVEASLTSRPPAADPWRAYGAADDRFWPELIARLHAEIKR